MPSLFVLSNIFQYLFLYSVHGAQRAIQWRTKKRSCNIEDKILAIVLHNIMRVSFFAIRDYKPFQKLQQVYNTFFNQTLRGTSSSVLLYNYRDLLLFRV